MKSYFETQKSRGFAYWGDINQMLSLTAIEDAAKVTVEAVLRKTQDGKLAFAGENITIREAYKRIKKSEKSPRNLVLLKRLRASMKRKERRAN